MTQNVPQGRAFGDAHAFGKGATAGMRLPLDRYQQLHTRDVDEARHTVAEAFCPHRLTVPQRERDFDTRFHAVQAGRVNLCYLDYGGQVDITVEPQESFYLVLAPLAGRAALAHGRQEARYDRSGAAVPPVDRPYRIDVQAHSPHLVLQISRTALEQQLRAMLGRPVAEPVRFALRMDQRAPDIEAWWRIVSLLREDAERGGVSVRNPSVMRPLEQALLGQLLDGQPHNYSARLHEGSAPASSAAVRRAVDLIDEHAGDREFTVASLACAVSLSIRALQLGFQREFHTTPSARLREARLRRAREDLLAATPATTTVSRVAERYAFSNYGRFAAYYRHRFGELPSDTLQR
ncbi:AraC family transcriptional regulator [Streptomyces sp. B8F3]|uniref:AraC family transcriptional regulator n=1 Tax=unclassified Streptomyces TaxID=2593676 RepID=UPI00325DA17D